MKPTHSPMATLLRGPAAGYPRPERQFASTSPLDAVELQAGPRGRLIELQGSPYALGWQHGNALGAEIRSLCTQFYKTFARGLFWPVYHRWVPRRMYHLWHFIPVRLQAELWGVAQGAQVRLRDVLLINLFDDIANLIGLNWGTACSSLAVRDPQGQVRLGRNLDYHGPVGDLVRAYQTVIVRRPEPVDGLEPQATLSVCVAGQVGILTGMNSAGLCLGSMTSRSTELNWHGLGASLLYRQVLDTCTTLDSAVTAMQQGGIVQGNNVLLTTANDAACLELTARRSAVRWLGEQTYLGITNHYLAPELAATHPGLGGDAVPSWLPPSQARYQRLSTLGEQGIDPRMLAELARIMTDCPNPQDWPTGRVINSYSTLHSVLFEPHLSCIQVAISDGKTQLTPASYQPVSFSATEPATVA